jgi:hypothetical protein
MLTVDDGMTAKAAIACLDENMQNANESIAKLATRLSNKKDTDKKKRIDAIYNKHIRMYS